MSIDGLPSRNNSLGYENENEGYFPSMGPVVRGKILRFFQRKLQYITLQIENLLDKVLFYGVREIPR